MATDSDKRCAVNAQRAAEHALRSILGNLHILDCLLHENGWSASVLPAFAAANGLKGALENLHDDLTIEATAKNETIPDQGVIKPLSGGTGKGGGGT